MYFVTVSITLRLNLKTVFRISYDNIMKCFYASTYVRAILIRYYIVHCIILYGQIDRQIPPKHPTAVTVTFFPSPY